MDGEGLVLIVEKQNFCETAKSSLQISVLKIKVDLNVMGLDTHDRYSAIMYKGDNFCVCLFCFLVHKVLLDVVKLGLLNKSLLWIKSFPFTVDLSQANYFKTNDVYTTS